MSPRFLFLVFRNLKTKLLGFGIESNIFPQIPFHCSYDEKELVARASYVKTAHYSESVCFDQQSLKITNRERYGSNKNFRHFLHKSVSH